MKRFFAIFVVLGFVVVSPAWGRVPSRKVIPQVTSRSRNPVFVPYLTNTRTTLGVYNGVAPRIYASPIMDYPSFPQTKPVYNLPFYGAVQSFGGRSNGATPRPPYGPAPFTTPIPYNRR